MVRRVLLVGLLMVGLLAAGGYLGWSQGYEAGLGSQGVAGPYWGGASGFFIGIGLFFKFLLVLFVVLLISKLLFFRGWRRHGGPGPHHWRGWRNHYDEPYVEGRPPRGPGGEDRPEVA